MKYTVDYFIKKFKAIPRSKWTTEEFANGTGQYCALGHCGQRHFFVPPGEEFVGPTDESAALVALFTTLDLKVELVNDHAGKAYNQLTPKGRILAALRDIKKALGRKQ